MMLGRVCKRVESLFLAVLSWFAVVVVVVLVCLFLGDELMMVLANLRCRLGDLMILIVVI